MVEGAHHCRMGAPPPRQPTVIPALSRDFPSFCVGKHWALQCSDVSAPHEPRAPDAHDQCKYRREAQPDVIVKPRPEAVDQRARRKRDADDGNGGRGKITHWTSEPYSPPAAGPNLRHSRDSGNPANPLMAEAAEVAALVRGERVRRRCSVGSARAVTVSHPSQHRKEEGAALDVRLPYPRY